MHYVYFTTNPLIRAGRISDKEWRMESRKHWLGDDWYRMFHSGPPYKDVFTLEEIEEHANRSASPQG